MPRKRSGRGSQERIAELEAVIERSVSLAEQAQILTKDLRVPLPKINSGNGKAIRVLIWQVLLDIGIASQDEYLTQTTFARDVLHNSIPCPMIHRTSCIMQHAACITYD